MIGFTTRTFSTAISRKATTLGRVVSWAGAQRFPWVEIRDGTLSLSHEELSDLAGIATTGGVRLHYAWDGTNILDPSDRALFEKGVQNGAVFGDDTFIRLTIAGRVIRDNPARVGYSKAELATLKDRIEDYIRIAAAHRVRIVFENSYEPLEAGSSGEAGIREMLEAVPGMNLTFDPGNFMDREHNRSFCSAAALKKFYGACKNRLPYVHVKMTKDNIVQPGFVEDADLEIAFYRQILTDGKLLCIELSDSEDLEDCRNRVLAARRMLTEG